MTVLEIARLATTDGDEFAGAVGDALAEVARDPGCRGASCYRGEEEPSSFVLIIEWDSIDAHERFRAGPGLSAYRSHIQHLLEGAPAFGHYRIVARTEEP